MPLLAMDGVLVLAHWIINNRRCLENATASGQYNIPKNQQQLIIHIKNILNHYRPSLTIIDHQPWFRTKHVSNKAWFSQFSCCVTRRRLPCSQCYQNRLSSLTRETLAFLRLRRVGLFGGVWAFQHLHFFREHQKRSSGQDPACVNFLIFFDPCFDDISVLWHQVKLICLKKGFAISHHLPLPTITQEVAALQPHFFPNQEKIATGHHLPLRVITPEVAVWQTHFCPNQLEICNLPFTKLRRVRPKSRIDLRRTVTAKRYSLQGCHQDWTHRFVRPAPFSTHGDLDEIFHPVLEISDLFVSSLIGNALQLRSLSSSPASVNSPWDMNSRTCLLWWLYSVLAAIRSAKRTICAESWVFSDSLGVSLQDVLKKRRDVPNEHAKYMVDENENGNENKIDNDIVDDKDSGKTNNDNNDDIDVVNH